MRRSACVFAVALSCSSRSGSPPPQPPPPPPAVHIGQAELICNIDSRTNGVQKLVITEGSGLEFDAVVSPIVDGKVALEGPDKGGTYQFTSHLAQPAKGTLSGVGDVEIETMETSVQVTMNAYSQPEGAGSEFTFDAADMARKGVYVQFSGVARALNSGDKYAFRVNFGAAKKGNGQVKPSSPNNRSEITAKAVMIEADYTNTVQLIWQAKAEVRKVP